MVSFNVLLLYIFVILHKASRHHLRDRTFTPKKNLLWLGRLFQDCFVHVRLGHLALSSACFNREWLELHSCEIQHSHTPAQLLSKNSATHQLWYTKDILLREKSLYSILNVRFYVLTHKHLDFLSLQWWWWSAGDVNTFKQKHYGRCDRDVSVSNLVTLGWIVVELPCR